MFASETAHACWDVLAIMVSPLHRVTHTDTHKVPTQMKSRLTQHARARSRHETEDYVAAKLQ